MKRYLSIVAGMLCAIAMSAQNTPQRIPMFGFNRDLTMESSVKFWDEGPLAFSDFQGWQDERLSWNDESRSAIEFLYGILWEPDYFRIGNTGFRMPTARAYMNPYSSWIQPSSRTPETLLFLQTGFDYLEVCSRQAKRDMLGGSPFDESRLTRFYLDMSRRFMSKMRTDTSQGQDSLAMNQFVSIVQEELAMMDEYDYADMIINPRGFAFGMYLGAGSEFYTGGLSQYVTPMVGLDFGFDMMISRFLLSFGGCMGWGGHYKKDIQLDGYKWNAGERITGGKLEISLGWTAYDSQWWRVTPFAGIGVGFLDYPDNPVDPDKDTDEISGFRYQMGLSADFKFYRLVELLPVGRRGLTEFMVRTKVFAAHTAFPAPAPAWSINFGIDVCMLPWIVKNNQ